MSSYWPEFLLVAAAHLVAVASPGPDFALVFRQSITHGRGTAVWTSIGIGAGIFIHISYSLLGLVLLIQSSVLWFFIVKYAGALYLAWIGFKALRTPPRGADLLKAKTMTPSSHGAFLSGFLVNVLNPKAALFFIAVFSVIVSPNTPVAVQLFYGFWLVVTTMAWFSLVSVFFTHDRVKKFFLRFGHWLDRVMGVLFIALSLRMALLSIN